MTKFFLFIKKIYVFLLFVILEAGALNFYAGSSSYTKAKMLTATNTVAGGVYRQMSHVGGYFGLRSENERLVAEIARLRNDAQIPSDDANSAGTYSTAGDEGAYLQYEYMPATVINNTIMRPENFITLDKGRNDGVEPNMAVITPTGGLVGYVLSCSDRFSVAISALNANFSTGGKIKGKDYFGSVHWNGNDHTVITLSEIPKYADITPGDTIVTDYSSIFPNDILIGTVKGYELTQSGYFDISVELSTQFSRLHHVLLVRYADIVERRLIEEEYNPQNER